MNCLRTVVKSSWDRRKYFTKICKNYNQLQAEQFQIISLGVNRTESHHFRKANGTGECTLSISDRTVSISHTDVITHFTGLPGVNVCSKLLTLCNLLI